jgi:hypothetical protein
MMGSYLRILRGDDGQDYGIAGSFRDAALWQDAVANARAQKGNGGWDGTASSDLSSPGGIQLVDYQALTPPGDCSPSQHYALQAEVDRACDQPRRCTSSDSKTTIDEKIDRNAQCISARQRINNICYRGGDAGHNQAIEYAQNALQRCHDLRVKVEQRENSKSEENSTWRNFSFMGLTGAAAIALYIGISEGSRLFPPRNLIPVP